MALYSEDLVLQLQVLQFSLSFALWSSCFAATSFAIFSVVCSMVCSAASCSDCSGLVGVGVTGIWIDEEILLKIFFWRPRRPYSSSESLSSIIAAEEEVKMVDCAGMAGCTDLWSDIRVREVGACRPEPWECWILSLLMVRWSSSSGLGVGPLTNVALGRGATVVEAEEIWIAELLALLIGLILFLLTSRGAVSCSSSSEMGEIS